MKILFSAKGDPSAGSYRIPFIGMREVMSEMEEIEILDVDSKIVPDVVICMAGQGEATRLRNLYPRAYILLAKPHYEIAYSFFWKTNFIKSVKSLIRAVVGRAQNTNLKRIKKDIEVSDCVISDSRRLHLSYRSEQKDSIFFRLFEKLPDIQYESVVPPALGGVLNVCYHGHAEMLNRAAEDFYFILKGLDRHYKVNFFCMTNMKNKNKEILFPGINTEFIDYDFSELVKLLPSMHIGLVPIRVRPSRIFSNKLLSVFLFGGFQDNLDVFAEKASANAGRAYLFSHFGVPFVADPSPELLLDFGAISELEFPVNRGEAGFFVNDILMAREKYLSISKKLIKTSSSKLNLNYETQCLITELKRRIKYSSN